MKWEVTKYKDLSNLELHCAVILYTFASFTQ